MNAAEPRRHGGHLGTCDALFGGLCSCDKSLREAGALPMTSDEALARLREILAAPRGITPAEAAAAIDAIPGDDPERDHGLADELVLAAVDSRVREAYVRLTKRAKWWAAA